MTNMVAPSAALYERDGKVTVVSGGRMGNGLTTEVRTVWTVQVDDAEALLDAVLASLAVFRQSMPPRGLSLPRLVGHLL